jgi:UbiD family decarboxylase
VNAQGEDVVAGIRTPAPVNEYSKNDQSAHLPTLEQVMPAIYQELFSIQKRLDGGPPMIFNKVKGYSNARLATNVMGSDRIIAKMFGCNDRKSLKFKIHESILHPIPPKVVDKAPCQEIVTDKNINIWPVIPMIQHTPTDPGRTLGAGKTVASPKHFWGGWHISYNRMNFREDLGWKDHSTFQISPGSHTDQIATKYYKKEPIPFSINIGICIESGCRFSGGQTEESQAKE